ncbi:MAG: tetratricopeptide repeat protein, partial [Bacteroidetes bacterium]
MSEEAPPGTGEDTAYLPENNKPIAVLPEDSSEAAKHIARAETFLQVGRAQEAISALETCLGLFDPGSTSPDPKWLRAKLDMMRALIVKNRMTEAYQILTEMRPLIHMGDARFKAAFEAAAGGLFLKTQTFDSAAYYLDHSLGIYQSGAVSDTAGHVRAWVSRGFLYCLQGQYEKGLESGEKALALAKAKFGTFHPATATVYNLLAFASSESNEYNNAVKYGRVVNDIYRSFEVDPMLRVAGLINLANYHSQTGAFDEAVEGFDSARALIVRYAASVRDTMLLGNVFYSLGAAEFSRKGYETSVRYFEQAIDVWLPGFGAGHPAIASCYSYLGVNYAALHDFDNARRYTRKAISIDTRNPQIGWHHPDVAMMYVDLAGIEQKAGFQDRAFALLDTAFFCLQYEPDAPDFYRNAVSTPALLKAFIQQGDFLFDKYRRRSDTSVLSEALAVYDRAFRVADFIQSDYRDPASIEFLSEHTYLLTEGALRALLAARKRRLQPNLTARIFNLFERNKDFLILKSLSENAFFERLEAADPDFREEGRLKKKISELEMTRQALSPEES